MKKGWIGKFADDSIETEDLYRPLFYHFTAPNKQQMKFSVDK